MIARMVCFQDLDYAPRHIGNMTKTSDLVSFSKYFNGLASQGLFNKTGDHKTIRLVFSKGVEYPYDRIVKIVFLLKCLAQILSGELCGTIHGFRRYRAVLG